MSNFLTPVPQAALRQTDSNTLLRMYDTAMGVFKNSPRQRDRERADRIVQRVVQELEKRNVLR
jgi:hypothetical protein